MGNTNSIYSEAVIGGVVIAGGVIYYSYVQAPPTSSSQSEKEVSLGSKKGKKKGKKASAEPDLPASSSQNTEPIVVGFPSVIPGQFDAESVASDEQAVSSSQSKKPKKKKTKGKSTPSGAVSSADSSTPVPMPTPPSTTPSTSKTKQKRTQQTEPSSSKSTLKTVPSFDTGTDGSWTQVSRRAKQGSDAGGQDTTGATTGTADSDDELEASASRGAQPKQNRRTLAEKLLPKPRKTGVDDMLETPDYPALSRVMRVQPRPDEKPAPGFAWGDYEDVNADPNASTSAPAAAEVRGGVDNDADGEDDDNDGWGVVKGRARTKTPRDPSTQASQSTSASQSSAEQSKRQRQNAAKRDAQKANKAAAEAERLATLARHKRELERTKMLEQYAGGGKGKKVTSGGMKATVDANGKMVWED